MITPFMVDAVSPLIYFIIWISGVELPSLYLLRFISKERGTGIGEWFGVTRYRILGFAIFIL